ncbi:MAG: methyltransferase domain-containing protein [Spirochaetes bacterium]|nr:methyltransferase domain-containing protein [Spirochaetota bacterium]
MNKYREAIAVRYSELAEKSCCLSCGGAINHSSPQPGEICVDLGSGRGNDVIRMAEAAGEQGFAYGIDISGGMLTKAQKTADRLGVKNVKFLKGELEKLPLDTEKADLIISNCTINHATDKQLVWNEIYRILKKGGRFVVSDIYASETVPKEYANDPQAIAECWAGSVTKDIYLEQLKNAGFKEITILEESDPYEKGKIKVSSFTILGQKPPACCCGNTR